MHSESRRHTLYHRLARAATVALAALTMAGCGGDWEVSFSGIDDNDKDSPSVFVVVSPARPTVGAGTIVRFEAVAINATPPMSFQWYRNGVRIAGANDSTYTLGGAQDGDDGALFQVTVVASNGISTASAELLVSTALPVVDEDCARCSIRSR